MNAKLITMEGLNQSNKPLSVLDLDPTKMNDFEAGLHMLKVVSELYPGITKYDLIQPEIMGNVWTFAKRAIGDVKDGIGDVISDSMGLFGRHSGDMIRLATDEQVIDGVSRAASAYATGGQSEALSSFFQNVGIRPKAGEDPISLAGAQWKSSLSNPMIIGGIVAALILIVGVSALASRGKGKK
jgi:hypothetical protein